ncbi:hypothetical protein GEMRC1_003977 [Eukaryota sp. GEM-RC1]
MFKSNNHLKVVAVSFCSNGDPEDELESFFNALSLNNSIESLDLLDFDVEDSNLAIPLLRSSTIQNLKFPQVEFIDSTVFSVLRTNTSIRELTLGANFNAEDLCEVLKFNKCLRKLELRQCPRLLSPIFKSLEFNSTLLELVIEKSCQKLVDHESEALVDMIKINKNLLVLYLTGSLINSNHFNYILSSFENNSTLKKVFLPSLDLGCLMTLFTHKSFIRSKSLIDYSPHVVDSLRGKFSFLPVVLTKINTVEMMALQSFLMSFRVKELTFRNCNFTNESLLDLCDLIRLNDSLTFIDFSYCGLYNHNVVSLLKVLRNNSCSKLTTINLSGNSISNEGALELMEFLKFECSIAKVNLQSNHFDSETKEFII